MGKQHLSLITCDGCGWTSMDGKDMQTLAMTAPGHLATVKRWDVCRECVAKVASLIYNMDKVDGPVTVEL